MDPNGSGGDGGAGTVVIAPKVTVVPAEWMVQILVVEQEELVVLVVVELVMVDLVLSLLDIKSKDTL